MNIELFVVLFGVISPTFWIARILKSTYNKQRVIRFLNWFYFIFSLVSIFIFVTLWKTCDYDISDLIGTYPFVICIYQIFLISRCSEVFVAFLKDAYDKVKIENTTPRNRGRIIQFLRNKTVEFLRPIFQGITNSSKIEMHHRLVLAFKSYMEVIINFSVLYSLVPVKYWKSGSAPHDIVDSLYFSGVTISTLGYGDITPLHWYPKFLSVFEVFCGFTLIVVCFAVYLSKNGPNN